MHHGDVRLTDEEERIIAAIERHERAERSRWRRVLGRRARRAPVGHGSKRFAAWSPVVVGTLLLGGGLISGLAIIGLAGFMLVVLGTSQLCQQASSSTWFPRMINHLFGSNPGQAPGP